MKTVQQNGEAFLQYIQTVPSVHVVQKKEGEYDFYFQDETCIYPERVGYFVRAKRSIRLDAYFCKDDVSEEDIKKGLHSIEYLPFFPEGIRPKSGVSWYRIVEEDHLYIVRLRFFKPTHVWMDEAFLALIVKMNVARTYQN